MLWPGVRCEDSCHCLLEINIPVYIEEYCDAISCFFFTSFTAVQISDLADVLKVHVCMHVTLSLVLYSSPSTGTLRTHNVASTQLA